jgi:GGDEF domain-containing protein
MINRSKEEKVLEHSLDIIESVCKNNAQNTLENEYMSLSKEYKNLLKRYNKIIKINDIMDENIINDNECLKEDKENIVKISKTKILDSITSKRELKEEFSKNSQEDRDTIKRLKEELERYKKSSVNVTERLTTTEIILKDTKTKVATLEEKNKKLNSEVQSLKEIATPFEETLEKEIFNARRNSDSLILCMIGIDNFNSLKNGLHTFTTIENFILGILKYLKHSLSKKDTVIYFEAEMFYILIPNKTLEQSVAICKMLGKRRSINKMDITLSAGISLLKDDDDTDDILGRCLQAYNIAINDSKHARIIEG